MSEIAVSGGELLAALAIAGTLLLTVAVAGGLWLKRRLRARLRVTGGAVARLAGRAAADRVRTRSRWLWSLPSPSRHWVAAVRTRRRLWRAVTAAEHAVAQARKAGAPTGDLDSLCRRLRQAAADADRSVAVAGRATGVSTGSDHASSQAADLIVAAGLIQDAAASSAASMMRPAVASLTEDVRQEVTALSAGLASATRSPGSRGLPGQPA
ncbi:MAG: hypothetical protein LBV78_18155 [Kitasatospora sp.]|nr:hypothetical protein [Kitasatospora sp.]